MNDVLVLAGAIVRWKRKPAIMIYIEEKEYEKLLTYCVGELPNEACGLLGGIRDGEKRQVKKVYLLTNIDKSPVHFSLDPEEQFAAVKDMRANGWEILGNFHSHPKSCARPSEEDIRLACDSVISYLILSLMDQGSPVLKAFQIDREKNVLEEEINISPYFKAEKEDRQQRVHPL